jgi:signal transduction histidine kinase
MSVNSNLDDSTSNRLTAETAQGKVLVVDDDAGNRDVLARRLKRQGYAVATAENGRQALEMMEESTFDLLLLDILMPEMDGFEVLKRLKSDDRLRHIPVIMISAMSETDSAVRCIEMGAEDYLPKPFDPTLLKARTVACFERKRAHEDRRQAAVLDERNRIACEIHDTMAQTFTGILWQLRAATHIADKQPEEAWRLIELVKELAQQGLMEARRSVWDLQPGAMEYRDLAGALALRIERLLPDAGAQIELRIHGAQRDLTPCIGMDLFRIGQEALTNALRHSQPGSVKIDLTFEAERVGMSIRDDGHGFDQNHQVDSGGFGLLGMRQRSERLGGHLTISSQIGQGTEIEVWAPIAPVSKVAEPG